MLSYDDGTEIRDCVILGAGFSKAVSPAMPVMWELGGQVIKRLGLPVETLRPFGDDVERWLSHLAVDQPWLSSADNLANRSLFLRASEAVGDCIDEAEARATSSPPPNWLLRLVHDWANREVVVITFNYDLLIERALASCLRLVGSLGDLYGMALTERKPLNQGLSFGGRSPKYPIPTLFKLHGSTNWGYGGTDAPPNELVTFLPKAPSWPSKGAEPTALHGPWQFLHDDLEPLIVPPAGSKNDFYRNRGLRAQWRHVASSLIRAERVSIIGFSFPSTDLQVRQLVATTIRRAHVDVVDRNANAVQTVQAVCDPTIKVVPYIEDDPLPSFVTATCGDLVRWSLHRVDDFASPHRARVSINDKSVFDELLDPDAELAMTKLSAFLNSKWPDIARLAREDIGGVDDPNRCVSANLALLPTS